MSETPTQKAAAAVPKDSLISYRDHLLNITGKVVGHGCMGSARFGSLAKLRVKVSSDTTPFAKHSRVGRVIDIPLFKFNRHGEIETAVQP